MAPEPEGDRLYALPLDEFTKARDALAARLKSAGDAEEAAGVKALKKPTTPAWAVNQLARSSRDKVEQLVASIDRLRNAQHELLKGGSAQGVWEATLAEREALAALTEDAERILADARYGATRATLDKVADTLIAAAADPTSRILLRRGILTAEMHRAGFDDLLDSSATAPTLRLVPDLHEKVKPSPKKSSAAGGPTPKHVLEAEREAARLERAAERTEVVAEKSEQAADRADREVDSARKRLASAERQAATASGDATAARKEARAARREAERAAARLDRLRKARLR